jgi:hypothetical protein
MRQIASESEPQLVDEDGFHLAVIASSGAAIPREADTLARVCCQLQQKCRTCPLLACFSSGRGTPALSSYVI